MQTINKCKIIFLGLLLFTTTLCFSQTVTYSKDWQGNTVEKDEYGNTISTYSKDWQGNTVKKDASGNTQSTYSKDWQGNTVKKDASGNTLGTYSKDWQGNTIYTPEY
ncbi:MAG: hypothetical protein HN535_00500 [Flavobacteriales bacterium]|mgnify:CR=1 FL=1|jgi:predicted lipoprotein with Yx(FWY)xxD motif|nr:hypothetical protein [Flavobacteriales bacterium]